MIKFLDNSDSQAKSSVQPLYFYNTLSKEKELFEPLKDDKVRMYTCGPTVYDYAHIGNLRSYLLSDNIRRVLRYNGYKVEHAMNMTDIGEVNSEGVDKMAVGVRREGLPETLTGMKQLADKYIDLFLSDLESMNIKRPHIIPRASEHIEEQIALIQTLVEKEYAYRTSDGVYFDTKRFPKYGALGNVDLEGLLSGARVDEHPEKRNPTDFSLWKRNNEIGWDSPWGHGIPGWHIECSAMSMKYLGKTFDIHTAGSDLIPTHHNNEIAQSECATGKQFVKYWMHGEMLNMGGEKFAKSLGNTLSLRDLEQRKISPIVYRYWLLTGHYRTPLKFSWEALEGANQALRRLHLHFFEELYDYKNGEIHAGYEERFHQAINDDLDTPKALATLWELIKDVGVEEGDKRATLLHFDKFLAIGLRRDVESPANAKTIEILPETIALKDLPEEIRLLVIARDEMREEKKWDRADELRDELKEKGYLVEDSNDGPQITRADY